MVQHIVLLKMKEGIDEESTEKLLLDIGRLRKKFSGIIDYSFGTDISGGGRAHGFTHGFVMTFSSVESLEEYLPHPDHSPILERVLSMSEKVLAFDYRTN